MEIKELVIYLRCFTISQIYQLVHRDEIPYKNTGKKLIFDKKEIDKWNKDRLLKLEKDKGYITLKEACQYLGLKKRTIYQWSSEGKIPSYKKGKFLMFKKEELDQWRKMK